MVCISYSLIGIKFNYASKNLPCLNTTTDVSPISSTQTTSHRPASSGVGCVIRGSAVACVALQSRRRSNFDISLTTMILYLLQKWSAISAAFPPVTITLHPDSAIALICDSNRSSSPLLKFINSSAFLISTVPCVRNVMFKKF